MLIPLHPQPLRRWPSPLLQWKPVWRLLLLPLLLPAPRGVCPVAVLPPPLQLTLLVKPLAALRPITLLQAPAGLPRKQREFLPALMRIPGAR